jgi:hypothetical protein
MVSVVELMENHAVAMRSVNCLCEWLHQRRETLLDTNGESLFSSSSISAEVLETVCSGTGNCLLIVVALWCACFSG